MRERLARHLAADARVAATQHLTLSDPEHDDPIDRHVDREPQHQEGEESGQVDAGRAARGLRRQIVCAKSPRVRIRVKDRRGCRRIDGLVLEGVRPTEPRGSGIEVLEVIEVVVRQRADVDDRMGLPQAADHVGFHPVVVDQPLVMHPPHSRQRFRCAIQIPTALVQNTSPVAGFSRQTGSTISTPSDEARHVPEARRTFGHAIRDVSAVREEERVVGHHAGRHGTVVRNGIEEPAQEALSNQRVLVDTADIAAARAPRRRVEREHFWERAVSLERRRQ